MLQQTWLRVRENGGEPAIAPGRVTPG